MVLTLVFYGISFANIENNFHFHIINATIIWARPPAYPFPRMGGAQKKRMAFEVSSSQISPARKPCRCGQVPDYSSLTPSESATSYCSREYVPSSSTTMLHLYFFSHLRIMEGLRILPLVR